MPAFRLSLPAGLLALGLCLASAAHADSGSALRVPMLPKYQQECAACHLAYPPGLLPAQSWQRLMQGLPNHFGTDASLDPASVQEISGWLATHAATGKRRTPPPDERITSSAWFQRKHHDTFHRGPGSLPR